MPQLVGGDVADAGDLAQVPQRLGDTVVTDRPIVFEQKMIGAQSVGAVVGDPVVEEFFQLRMQGM